MIFGFPTLHASGDPNWDNVLLLLKMQGADASLIATDSSKYADSKVCNTGQEIDTAQKKWGSSSLYVSQDNPVALAWNQARFARAAGEAITCEGWFKSTSQISTTATPAIFSYDSGASGVLVRVTKYGTGDRIGIRLGGGGSLNFYTYTPDADGWVYWMVRIKADGTVDAWVNTTLVESSGSIGTWSTSGKIFIAGTEAGGGGSAINCWLGETRITKADIYPSGVLALPSEFPVG